MGDYSRAGYDLAKPDPKPQALSRIEELEAENKRLREMGEKLLEAVNTAVKSEGVGPGQLIPVIDEETSDGYHTFRELYDHRRALTAALGVTGGIGVFAWRSRQHHPEDSACFPGYFIVGIQLIPNGKPGGTITYHYADQYWDDFKEFHTFEHAPKWDGAGPAETVTRLLDYATGRL